MDRKEVIKKAVNRLCSSPLICKERFLRPEWLEANEASGIAVTGFCWVATGAIYGLLGGPSSGYKIMSCKMMQPCEGSHYWLEDKATGEIFDSTSEQLPKGFAYRGKSSQIRSYKVGRCLEFRKLLEKAM
jgi:hypothetical protein